jgi:hypothetical protein
MADQVLCAVCGCVVDPERVEALPGVTTCVEHSSARRQVCYMVPTAAKGTAMALVVVPQNKEAERQARNAFLRKR